MVGGRGGDGVLSQAMRGVFQPGSISGLNEIELLERFAARRDEIAFAALLARHGPLVLGVCRRILEGELLGFRHDQEDVYHDFKLISTVPTTAPGRGTP